MGGMASGMAGMMAGLMSDPEVSTRNVQLDYHVHKRKPPSHTFLTQR